MTRMRWLTQWLVVGCMLLAPTLAGAATIERFTPQGPVKQVRQAVAVFSAPMVPFGDLRAVAPPFSVTCPVAGSGRWVDTRTWAYDFEKDLPGGIGCSFALTAGLKDRAGKPITGQIRFDFTTGGPAVESSRPGDGSENIDAQQAFVLELDGEATPESVAQHAAFEVDGLAQRVGVELIGTPEREQIVAALPYWLKPSGPYVVLRARQTFPDATKIRLIWGAGIVSPAGVATDSEQVLEFETRPKFTAEVTCQRENAKADCIPLTAINIRFSAPVAWAQASAVRLTGADGAARSPVEPDDPADSVTWLEFAPPFPPAASFTVTLPAELRDDAGRALANAAPLTAKTAPYPPLAKFAARFGLLESKADPALPVTIRNLDPDTKGQQLRTTAERPTEWRAKLSDLYARLSGASVRVDKPEELLPWLRRLAEAKRDRSIFDDLPAGETPSGFTLPQPEGPETMQVVGLPLPAPGFYLVELTSPRLGESLLDGAGPLYVPAGALVTNMAVHLKWGRENALVWVTTLDSAQPVEGARIAVQQCDGSVLGTGVTDAQGVARFSDLPIPDEAKSCDSPELKGFTGIDYQEYYVNRALTSLNSGLFVSAQTSGDLSFVHSSWDQGIESWRFNLPSEGYDAPLLAHTIFDRSLFRAGETVHMKYVLRSQTLAGFGAAPDTERPTKAVVRHLGSNERFELPISWDANGMAEATWTIPAAAKLGAYDVQLTQSDDSSLDAGGFRVEQFRVPLMKGTVQLPATPLVAASSAPVDVAVQYLAGGPAADQPVVVRAQVRDRRLPENEAYENLIFANGPVEVGVERSSDSDESEDSNDSETSTAVKQKRELVLDAAGTARTEITDLPAVTTPRELLVEAEYRDPNGETQTAAATAALWPAGMIPGIEVKRWVGGAEDGNGKSPPTPLLQRGESQRGDTEPSIDAKVVVLDTSLKPVAGARVQLDAFTRQTYSHRKRVVGGFYTYEHVEETAAAGELCHGETDAQGVFTCRVAAPARGEIVVQATVRDAEDRPASAHASAYIPGSDELGFSVTANDRIDVLPEKREVEPGATARLQVRMPFKDATALVTVEREGIGPARVVALKGDNPVVEVPIDGSMAPNTFISVLVVRGRVAGTQPTAMLDLGKPAFRLGIAELRVGWRDHTLNVTVESDRPTYRVRETAQVSIAVRTANGAPPPAGSEVALAAVDEGLLELSPNPSWNLLNAMMGRRGYNVTTATAQLQVIGKRHFGRKALPHGGGGGRQSTRELFDTLLLWNAKVPLDAAGNATVSIPLNDSLTAFRIVAVASGGLGLFGTGATEIRSTQPLMLLSGLPPLVREGDRFPAQFTLRNTTEQPLEVGLAGSVEAGAADPIALAAQSVTLAAGEARVVEWPIDVPAGSETLHYSITAQAGDNSDQLAVKQQVRPAVPVRTLQATLLQVDKPLEIETSRPADALPDRGGVEVALAASLGTNTAGVDAYLRKYPYTCLEQQTSIAVGLRDQARWQSIAEGLPSYQDNDGLLKFFPTMSSGSEVLTAYVLSIINAAGWTIPEAVQEKMVNGLRGFVAGSVTRDSVLRAPDLTLRKLAALAALARVGSFEPAQLDSLAIEPNLWPTSAVLDWWSILQRGDSIPNRDARMAAVEQILRARINVQGTVLTLSDEGEPWWLMSSADQNAVRLVLQLVELNRWRDDLPRLMRGALARQGLGHWDTTPANAWGVLALTRFAAAFESTPITGQTAVALGEHTRTLDWAGATPPPALLPWPPAPMPLSITQQGTGAPWASVSSRAAIPLTAPLASGYRIQKTVTPLEPKTAGQLTRGDRLKVRLDIDADADMTWVVFDDPVPAGASHLGTGLGNDSRIGAAAAAATDLATPDYVERRFDAYRAYFQFLPKGRSSVEYVVRLNQSGRFDLPPTRVEALYSPEMFGESPNAAVEVAP
jgi:uncharacterized protein YfaS (alpha-2-macroglobulin family)